jgi:phospholipid transport system substrate-binding protein
MLMTAAAVALPFGASAQSAGEARALVDQVVADINAVIDSGKSEAGMIQDFEGIFDRYSDVATIARYALGADARSASRAQMDAFTAAFRGYISRKYGRRFREFIGGRIEVRGERAIPRGIQVETMTILRGQAPFRVDFHVSNASGKTLFFNIIIEGIDMLLSERTEIGAMLDRRRGDINGLIADMQNT